MSDNDDLDLVDVDGDIEESGSGKKRKLGFFPALLKWIAIGLAILIVIVTVSLITVKIATKNTTVATAVPVSPEYKSKREVLSWYDGIDTIRVNSSDKPSCTIVADVIFGYTENDKAVSAEITSRSYEISDWLRVYFRKKTKADLEPQNENMIKMEIQNGINDDILYKAKIKDVVFKQLDIIEQ